MNQEKKLFNIALTKKRIMIAGAAVSTAAVMGAMIFFAVSAGGSTGHQSEENSEYLVESGLYEQILEENGLAQEETSPEAIEDMLVSLGLTPNANYLSGIQGYDGNIIYTPNDLPISMNFLGNATAGEPDESAEDRESETEDESEEPVSEEETESETAVEETSAEPIETEPETEEEPEPDPRTSVWDKYGNLGVVIAPNYLHIRTSPSLDGEIVGILYNMSGVDLLELSADGAWYRISSNGVEGYINAEFVAIGEEAKQLAYDHAFPAIRVNTEVLNVRQQPNTESTILTQIIAESLYPVIEFTNEAWLKISIGSEIEGYVSVDYVTWSFSLQDAVAYVPPEPEPEIPAINPVRTQIVNLAMQYLGGRYVWGGTALGVGVDCSGFMLKLYEQFGYALPRTSYWQVNSGVPVSFEEMKPGDLIFYWNNNLGRIGHVAMYIGNNQIVHAASEARGIVIDDYRFMTPYCARNIIGE